MAHRGRRPAVSRTASVRDQPTPVPAVPFLDHRTSEPSQEWTECAHFPRFLPPSTRKARKRKKKNQPLICTQRKRSTVGFVLFSTNSKTSLFMGEAVARRLDFRLWSHAPRRTDGTSTVHRYLGGAFTVTLVLTFVCTYTFIHIINKL